MYTQFKAFLFFIIMMGCLQFAAAQNIDGGATREPVSYESDNAATIEWLKTKIAENVYPNSESVSNIKVISLTECVLVMELKLNTTVYRLDLPTNISEIGSGGYLDYTNPQAVKMYATLGDDEDDYYNFSIFLKIKDNSFKKQIETKLKQLAGQCNYTASTTISKQTSGDESFLNKPVTTSNEAITWMESFLPLAIISTQEEGKITDIEIDYVDECAFKINYKWGGTPYYKIIPTNVGSISESGTFHFEKDAIEDRISDHSSSSNFYSTSTFTVIAPKYISYKNKVMQCLKLMNAACDE